MQRIARKNWRIEKNLLRWNWSCKTSENWRIVHATTEESYDCVSDDVPNSEFTEQNKFLVRCKRILRSWTREQLWSDPRSSSISESQNLAALRLWIAAWYTEWVRVLQEMFFWTTTCSRRTTLCNLPHFKDFGIFFSGIGNRWMRVFNHTTSKSWSGMSNHTCGTYSYGGMMDYRRILTMEWNLGK